jgi:ribosomal protein S18 acetylase RimI-like enzyme
MYEFYVISWYRSQWIWRKLFTFFQKSAVDKKCTIIRVSTSFTNLEGQKFYKNIWFHESEIVFDKKIN